MDTQKTFGRVCNGVPLLIFAFDPSTAHDGRHLDTDWAFSTYIAHRQKKGILRKSYLSTAVRKCTILPGFSQWLQLQHQAYILTAHDSHYDSSSIDQYVFPQKTRYYYYRPQVSHWHDYILLPSSDPQDSPTGLNYADKDVSHRYKNVVFLHIVVECAPIMTWAAKFCNDILGSKLMAIAKMEHSKAVNSTLGGAYATLQRAGWAKLYARRQLAIARFSGDPVLEVRANIYLEICKIISILHPEYSHRKIHHSSKKGITTTKTDHNVSAAEAHKPTEDQRLRLKSELEALMPKAEATDDESLRGLIKYAMFKLNSSAIGS